MENTANYISTQYFDEGTDIQRMLELDILRYMEDVMKKCEHPHSPC